MLVAWYSPSPAVTPQACVSPAEVIGFEESRHLYRDIAFLPVPNIVSLGEGNKTASSFAQLGVSFVFLLWARQKR